MITVTDMTSGFNFKCDTQMEAFEMVQTIREAFPEGEILIEVE